MTSWAPAAAQSVAAHGLLHRGRRTGEGGRERSPKGRDLSELSPGTVPVPCVLMLFIR